MTGLVGRGTTRRRLLKTNHCFAWFRVTKFFPRQALNRFVVVLQRLDGRLQFARGFFLLLDLRAQGKDFLAHPFVLLYQRQIPTHHEHQPGHKRENCGKQGEGAPDAQVDFHGGRVCPPPAKGKKINVFPSRPILLNPAASIRVKSEMGMAREMPVDKTIRCSYHIAA